MNTQFRFQIACKECAGNQSLAVQTYKCMCKRAESEYGIIIVHQWVVCGAGSLLRSWSDVISSRDRNCWSLMWLIAKWKTLCHLLTYIFVQLAHTLQTEGFQDCNTKLAKATTSTSITLENMSVTCLAVCCCNTQSNITK